jgi:group II intron reverse transcriptase/maturase
MGFTSLNHHLDLLWLYEAFGRTRRDGAPGVDGQTAADYQTNLRENLQSLLERAKSGTYRAPPVRRVHIPKGPGSQETRPLGIPTLEDKVLQRAVVMVLEPIYEQDFLDCSYGFRPGRSAHQALEALWQQTMRIGGGWILDVDIQKFFDMLDRAHLRAMLSQRMRDGVLRRLIGKWLKAGVLEDGSLSYPETGTPQGVVVSPLLANIYLHYVVDVWFEREIKPHLRGRAFLIRYADDLVLGFASEADARWMMEELPKRFGAFGLRLHPDKTCLVPFGRPGSSEAGRPTDQTRPGTFTFLGFTHYWGKSRRGGWVVQRKTSTSRFQRAVGKIAEWCRRNRHLPIKEQHETLSQKLRGHDGYYGVTGNSRCLGSLRHVVYRIWKKWLSRRSRKAKSSWSWFNRLRRAFPLPPPRVVRSVYR